MRHLGGPTRLVLDACGGWVVQEPVVTERLTGRRPRLGTLPRQEVRLLFFRHKVLRNQQALRPVTRFLDVRQPCLAASVLLRRHMLLILLHVVVRPAAAGHNRFVVQPHEARGGSRGDCGGRRRVAARRSVGVGRPRNGRPAPVARVVGPLLLLLLAALRPSLLLPCVLVRHLASLAGVVARELAHVQHLHRRVHRLRHGRGGGGRGRSRLLPPPVLDLRSGPALVVEQPARPDGRARRVHRVPVSAGGTCLRRWAARAADGAVHVRPVAAVVRRCDARPFPSRRRRLRRRRRRRLRLRLRHHQRLCQGTRRRGVQLVQPRQARLGTRLRRGGARGVAARRGRELPGVLRGVVRLRLLLLLLLRRWRSRRRSWRRP
eukprot:Rhum_TRINITY_DN15158_c12_g1::Rhum_TRINITY_DN15158_c12_g1_i1::g.141316::m.141316